MVFLFIGEDEFEKDKKLAIIKRDCLGKEAQNFNLDILHSRDADLKTLQETLLRLPVKVRRRIVVVRDALKLKEPARDFIISYVKKPYKHAILILDIRRFDKKDAFLSKIYSFVKAFHFKESELVSTFKLADEVGRKKVASSLSLLHQLLSQGEKPERIMGGLRYAWERGYVQNPERARRLSLLLNCDIDIKRGRLPPEFALEKLLVSLCCL